MKWKCTDCASDNTAEVTAERYHYKELGLDNVFLTNFRMIHCYTCGGDAHIYPALSVIHTIIARNLLFKSSLLSGREATYLRKHAGLDSALFARLSRISIVRIKEWENMSALLNYKEDRLVRIITDTFTDVEVNLAAREHIDQNLEYIHKAVSEEFIIEIDLEPLYGLTQGESGGIEWKM